MTRRPEADGKPEDANVDQLRHRIDTGQTGDKVAFSDPSAAPLGTDAEAGGHSPSPEEVSQASRYETGHSRTEATRQTPAERQRTIIPLKTGLIVILLMTVVLAGLFFVF